MWLAAAVAPHALAADVPGLYFAQLDSDVASGLASPVLEPRLFSDAQARSDIRRGRDANVVPSPGSAVLLLLGGGLTVFSLPRHRRGATAQPATGVQTTASPAPVSTAA